MVGKVILYDETKYRVTHWDDDRIELDPPDPELCVLLRQVKIANVPFVYHYDTDVYRVYHPNLPPIPTDG